MSRLRTLTLFAALIALASVLAACGSGGSGNGAQSIAEEAMLRGVESGKLDISFNMDAKGEKGGHLEFRLLGPFEDRGGEAPLKLAMTVEASGSLGGKKTDFDGGLTLLGNKAYVGYEDIQYDVDPTTFNVAKSVIEQKVQQQADRDMACQDIVGDLELTDFVDGLRDESGVLLYGKPTTEVSGEIDVPALIGTLQRLAEDPACAERLNVAGSLPSSDELETAQESVKAAHAELFIDRNHILNRVEAHLTIEQPKGPDVDFESANLDLELTLTGINQVQAISAPEESKPLNDLFLKLGVDPVELLDSLEGQGAVGGIGNLLKTAR